MPRIVRSRGRRTRGPALGLDRLEQRRLLASLGGTLWNDLDSSGSRTSAEPGLYGWNAYVDFNNNGRRDDDRRSFVSTDPPRPINDGATTTWTIDVSGLSGTVRDVDVHLDLTHGRTGDLTITLESPSGTRVMLYDRLGEGTDDFTNTVLDDDAIEPISDANAPYVGRWRPQGALFAFDGDEPNGRWTLEIEDVQAGIAGSLLGWSLDVANVRTERFAVTDADGAYRLDGIRTGTHTVRADLPAGWVGTTPARIALVLNDDDVLTNIDFGAAWQAGGSVIEGSVWHDIDGNGQRGAQESALSDWPVFLDLNDNGRLDTQPTAFESSFGGIIPDLGILQSTVFAVGSQSPVTDVNLRFSIDHTFVSDLEAYLISPAGTRVLLFSQIGCCDNEGFVETLLDDQAEVDVTDWVTPYTGAFRPTESFSAFHGENADGEWIFEIADLEAFDTGGLVEWTLEISTEQSASEPLAVTDGQGHYRFDELPAGDYPVRQRLPSGWLQTFPDNHAAHVASVDGADTVEGLAFGNREEEAISPPTVLSIEWNTGFQDPPDLPSGTQETSWRMQRSDLRSITVTFSTPITASAADLRLTNLGVDAPLEVDESITLTDDHVAVDGSTLTITMGNQELPDGVYSLEILPGVTDMSGVALDGNADGVAGDSYLLSGNSDNGFYKIAGEFNGDFGVSIFDFSIFAYWFGQPVGVAPEYMDLNDDAGVSILDFVLFSENFGRGVIFPSALSAAVFGATLEREATPESDEVRNEAEHASPGTDAPMSRMSPHVPDRRIHDPAERRPRDRSSVGLSFSQYMSAVDELLGDGQERNP